MDVHGLQDLRQRPGRRPGSRREGRGDPLRGAGRGAGKVRQGETYERFTFVSLDGSKWILKAAIKGENKSAKEVRKLTKFAHADENNRLRLTPGTHKVCVLCLGIAPLGKEDRAGASLRPVSNAVEIETVEAKK